MATLFRENGIKFERVNYFRESLTEVKLKLLLKKAGLRPFDVLRKGEGAFKELAITPETPDDEVISMIFRNPNLLQRPIVEVGDRAVLARPIEKALILLNRSSG